MATKRGFSGWRCLSKLEEAAYNGAAAIATTFRNAADPINLVAEIEDGTTLVGTAAEEANAQQVLAYHSEGPEDLPRLRPNEAALYLAFLWGNVSQSPVDEPASTYYTHTISPFPKTFTEGAQDGSGVALTTITVNDTGSFPSSGSIVVESSGNTWTYSGKTAVTFTGVNSCTDNIPDNTGVHRLQPDRDYLLPSFSVLDYIGAANKRQWDGCMLQSFEISGDRKGWVRASGRIIGSGTYDAPETARSAEISEVYLKMGDVTITIGGTFTGHTFSGGTNISANVRSFRYSCENQIPDELVYLPSGGKQMGRAERLQRRQSLQLAVEFDDGTEAAYVTSQTNLNLLISMTGATGSYGMKLIFPQFKFNTMPISGGTGVLLQTMDAGIQYHATYGSVMAQVINKQTGYLHA